MLFEEQLETAIALALKLETLLASEYSSLKVQDISTFQNIQSTTVLFKISSQRKLTYFCNYNSLINTKRIL